MPSVERALVEDFELRRRVRYQPCNIQPGFVPQDINAEPWVLAIASEDRAAYMREQISGQEMMERNREKMAGRGICGIHVCPHYALVEICAWLAGITPEELTKEPKFCGLQGKAGDPGFSPVPLVTFPSANLTPRAMCRQIYPRLVDLLQFVQQPKPEELSGTIELGDLDSQQLLLLQDAVASCIRKIKNRPVSAEELLQQWRDIVFQACCVSFEPDDLSVPASVRKRCRNVSSADELTDKEVISTVSHLRDALLANVLGSESARWRDSPADKCPYAPQSPGLMIHTSV